MPRSGSPHSSPHLSPSGAKPTSCMQVLLSLSDEDLEDVRQLLADRVDKAERMTEQAAAEIVQYADNPSSKEFRKAVADHRNFSGTAKYYRDILERVVAAQATTHTTKNAADVAA